MGIFQRTNDLIFATLHDALDRLEQPEKMLRHELRETEAAIDQVSAATARSIAAEKLLRKDLAEHERQVQRWHDRATAAVESNNDSLARSALRRKQEHQRAVEALSEQLAEAEAANQTLRAQIAMLRERYAAASRRFSTFEARRAVAAARGSWHASAGRLKVRQSAMQRMERLLERLEFAEAESVALAELEASSDEPSSEFDVRSTEAAVESELTALKQRQQP